jgi:hypothetical protein
MEKNADKGANSSRVGIFCSPQQQQSIAAIRKVSYNWKGAAESFADGRGNGGTNKPVEPVLGRRPRVLGRGTFKP